MPMQRRSGCPGSRGDAKELLPREMNSLRWRRGLLVSMVPVLLSIGRCTVTADLRPMTALTSNCYDFPARNFDPKRSIEAAHEHSPHLPMLAGDDAIDFELHDLEGNPWVLSNALQKGMPVVMIWGMYTCPDFQGLGGDPPFDRAAYWDEYDLVESNRGRATFVHLYGPEPHPTLPGTNFDVGTQRPQYWSVVHQHRNYADRVAMAESIRDKIHPGEVMLPDYLPGNPYSELIQPVWCSYAQGARPVTVVSPEGKIIFQRGWFQADHVKAAIESFWNGSDIIGGARGRQDHGDSGDEGPLS